MTPNNLFQRATGFGDSLRSATSTARAAELAVRWAAVRTGLLLIDEYEFVVHPRVAGHGPTLFAGLSKHVDLKLVSRLEFGSGAVAMRYEPRR